jgi:hypothetical protein
MDKCELNGNISESGEVVIHNRRLLREWASRFKGKNIKIRIERAGSRRSHPQLNYYFGVVVEEIRLALLQLGHQMTKEETHDFLKGKFNAVQIANSQGEAIEVPGSTATMTKTEFGEYIDKIIQFAAEYLNIQIPLPGEKLEMQFH